MIAVRARCVCMAGALMFVALGQAKGEAWARSHTNGRVDERSPTVEDMLGISRGSGLKLAPDGRHFIVQLRSMDLHANAYKAAWYVGNWQSKKLGWIADGGDLKLAKEPWGFEAGNMEDAAAKWSPDGQLVAFRKRSGGQVQVWISDLRGPARQITHNQADVIAFKWGKTGLSIIYEVGRPREELRREAARRRQEGYRYNLDLDSLLDFLKPEMVIPPEKRVRLLVLDVVSRKEQAATKDQEHEYDASQQLSKATYELRGKDESIVDLAEGPDGQTAWTTEKVGSLRKVGIHAQLAPGDRAILCSNTMCPGGVRRLWWSSNSDVVIWAREGLDDHENTFFLWTPSTQRVQRIFKFGDDTLSECDFAIHDIICLREGVATPPEIIKIGLDGRSKLSANLNPQLHGLFQPKVERIEWETPTFAWNETGGPLASCYPHRAYGYILYPRDFDPRKKYPVFIDPYNPNEFGRTIGNEQPVNVYAADGILVLRTAFPWPSCSSFTMALGYSAALGFPHLTMLAGSTFAGLDTVARRGFVDLTRVGIGGVSHGTFVPLFMMQKEDRITAASISSASWSPEEYYWPTKRGRSAWSSVTGEASWPPSPRGTGAEYWSGIDIAQHASEIEAPIIMHHAAYESLSALRFMRELDEAGRPYDAYVYAGETHEKWQPAHIQSIQRRNLDWFRFWLQDYVDPGPSKAEQYQRWQELRVMQCKNPRAIKKCN